MRYPPIASRASPDNEGPETAREKEGRVSRRPRCARDAAPKGDIRSAEKNRGEGRLPGLASEDKMARPTALVVQQCCGHHRTPLTFFHRGCIPALSFSKLTFSPIQRLSSSGS